MQKINLEIDDELIKFFQGEIDNIEPVEIMLVKMLKFLREILETAN